MTREDSAATAAAAVAAAATRTDMIRNARRRRRKNSELRILVTRYWARGHRRNEFVWMHSLSPSADLLSQYRRGDIDWNGFARMYVAQLADDETARRSIRGLHDIAASGARDVVLYCHEEQGNPCHRHILREMVVAGRAVDSAAMCTRFVDSPAKTARAYDGAGEGGGKGSNMARDDGASAASAAAVTRVRHAQQRHGVEDYAST